MSLLMSYVDRHKREVKMLLMLVHRIVLSVFNEAGKHCVRRHLDIMCGEPVVGNGCLGVGIYHWLQR